MKIVVVGRIFPDSFAKNIGVTLENMGHKVTIYEENKPLTKFLSDNSLGSHKFLRYIENSLIRFSSKFEQKIYKSLIKIAIQNKPDLILVTYNNIPPKVTKIIKELIKVKIVLWFPDDLSNLDRQYLFQSNYDVVFLKDPFMVKKFKDKLGLNVYYLPEAFSPIWHKKIKLFKKDIKKYGCDLTIASNMYPYRARLLDQFANYNFKIWGDKFPTWLNTPLKKCYQREFVAELSKSKAFNSAKIVLNTLHYSAIEGVNCRFFEIIGCGGFQIVDWNPALNDLAIPDEEVVTFKTRNELKEKVDYFLNHPKERKIIADKAYQRAQKEHTYEKRLDKLLKITFS